MAKCANDHDQPADARFCGICGLTINDSDDSQLQSTSDGTDHNVTVNSVINLDLLEEIADSDPSLENTNEGDLLEADEDDALGEDNDSADSEIQDPDDEEFDDGDSDLDQSLNQDLDEFESTEFDDDFQFGRTVNSTVTDALRKWADENDEQDDPYVSGLLEAIDSRSDLTMWASLNPIEVLPHPSLTRGVGLSRAASAALTLRNVLIFVPVLLTWLSIGRAVGAYREYAREFAEVQLDQESFKNFLQFWDDPGSYLSNFWTIGDVSQKVAILIFLIIALTFANGILNSRAQAIRSGEGSLIDKDRLRIALLVSNALHGKRQANPESIGEALAEALNDLTQAARDVNEAASKLEETALGVSALNPHVEALNTNAQDFFNNTGKQVVASIRELVSSVEGLNSSVAGNITSLFTEAAVTIEEVGKQLAKTNASVEYGTKQLRDDLEAIHSQLQGVIKGGRT